MAFLLTALKDKYVAMRGFHTKRHLVVIESDDWGSIRMPSREVFEKLQAAGDDPAKDGFLSNDCLERESDLLHLLEVLSSVKDSKGHPAVMTANFAMANPDFDKIDYQNGQYAYEPFYETYRRYYQESSHLRLIADAMKEGTFCPQLHCREHMNVNRWMRDLKAGKADTRLAFENRMIGTGASFSKDNVFGYMDAFHTDCETDAQNLANVLCEAADIFEKAFGFRSRTFVASCFVWHPSLEEHLLRAGVKGIQCAKWQNMPSGRLGEYAFQRKIHFTGERNKQGQVYTVRNCDYEPAYYQNPEECAARCLQQVKNSFKQKKPAIINSHRFNYIGAINPANAQNNLAGLQWLLSQITDAFPDVEFISTPELIDICSQEKK